MPRTLEEQQAKVEAMARAIAPACIRTWSGNVERETIEEMIVSMSKGILRKIYPDDPVIERESGPRPK